MFGLLPYKRYSCSPEPASTDRLRSWRPVVSYSRLFVLAKAVASVSPRLGCHRAWIPHLSAGSRMGPRGPSSLLPGALPHSKMRSRSAALDGEVATYVFWVHIKASQGGSFPALSFLSLHPFPPRLAVRWSAGVDRGVRPPISKHFQGVRGENATQHFLHYVVKITGKNQTGPRAKLQIKQANVAVG